MFSFIFILLQQIVVPVDMIVMGNSFLNHTPKMNTRQNYRTEFPLSSETTWLSTHRICGKIWIVLGIIALAAAAVITAYLGFCGILYDNAADKFIYSQWAVQCALYAAAFPAAELVSKRNIKQAA